MSTFGKKFSSACAVACVWVGGSGIVQLAYLAVVTVGARVGNVAEESAVRMWLAVPAPLLVAGGGTCAVWLLRTSCGWPQMSLLKLFWQSLCLALFSLALLPSRRLNLVAGAALVLGVTAAIILTWLEAARHSLGTRFDPKSTLVVTEQEGEEGSVPQDK